MFRVQGLPSRTETERPWPMTLHSCSSQKFLKESVPCRHPCAFWHLAFSAFPCLPFEKLQPGWKKAFAQSGGAVREGIGVSGKVGKRNEATKQRGVE